MAGHDLSMATINALPLSGKELVKRLRAVADDSHTSIVDSTLETLAATRIESDAATIASLSAERDELLSAKANMREYATMLVKLREQFVNIKDELEDEGDRIYFGSTNDADTFREVVQGLDDLAWDQIMRDSVDGPDIYAAARINHARAEAAEAQIASLRARVGELERANSLRPDYPLTCQECGRAHILDTSLPSNIWNQIADPSDVLCTLCIDRRLKAKGLTTEAEFYFAGEALLSRLYEATEAALAAARQEGFKECREKAATIAETCLITAGDPRGIIAATIRALTPGGDDET